MNCDFTEGHNRFSYNAANERIKRHYFTFLAEAQGHSEQTIDAVAKSIARFETYARSGPNVVAFTILTGARDGARASFKLRHIDIADGKIDQDAREVRTKFSKSFVTTGPHPVSTGQVA